MRVNHDLDGILVLICTDVELGLVVEGLHVVEDSRRRCLEAK